MNYYRRYVGDYMRDTADLSMTEHGAYNLLIDYCYATERLLPTEYARLYRICFASVAHEQEAVRFVADRFFPVVDGKRRHKRIEEELGKALPAIEEMRKAGKKGADRRWGKDGVGHRDGDGVGDRVAIHPPTSNLQPPAANLQENVKSTVGLKPDAMLVLEFLNEKTGRNYKPRPSNLKLIEARLQQGASVDDCRAVIAKKCREWTGKPEMDVYLRPKTLFNATNFAQYEGELT